MTAIRLAPPAALAFLAGFVLLLLDLGVVASAVGLGLMAFSGVALALLAFLAVGQSEDRDRLRRPHG
jgi:hypothetical protein